VVERKRPGSFDGSSTQQLLRLNLFFPETQLCFGLHSAAPRRI
jgi:hypothetical protein